MIGTRIANREACDSCTTEEASMNSLQLNGLAAARDGRKNAEELSRCPENLMAAPVPANVAANLKRTVKVVRFPDLTRKFAEFGLLIPVPREGRC